MGDYASDMENATPQQRRSWLANILRRSKLTPAQLAKEDREQALKDEQAREAKRKRR